MNNFNKFLMYFSYVGLLVIFGRICFIAYQITQLKPEIYMSEYWDDFVIVSIILVVIMAFYVWTDDYEP